MSLIKITKIANSERVLLADNMKELLGTKLQFGMSNFVCKYGALSDGHEKITDAQRYYQSIKEMYGRAQNIQELECSAMDAQADLEDAELELKSIKKNYRNSEKLRIEAKIKRAESRLRNSLMNMEDNLRQLNAFNEVYEELHEKVESKYKSIEDAELDNWIAVAEYRSNLKKVGNSNMLTHIPLPKDVKAELGTRLNDHELKMWLLVSEKDEIIKNFGGDANAYLADKFDKKRIENNG